MRNPWGSYEWKGAWSDKDRVNWTPELSAQLGHVDANDGMFFMEINDYEKFFNLTAVCAINAGDGTSSEIFSFVPGQKKQKKTIAFNIPVATDCTTHPLFISVST